jgi:WD40 repeat protein
MADNGSSAGHEIIPEDSNRQISLPPEMVRKGLELAIKIEALQGIENYRKPILKVPGVLDGACISFSKDGKAAAITCYGEKKENLGWMIWNVITKRLSIYPEGDKEVFPPKYNIVSRIRAVGKEIVGKRLTSISSFDISPNLPALTHDGEPVSIPGKIFSVALSNNGNFVLIGYGDGSIFRGVIVDSVIQDFRVLIREANNYPVTALCFSPDHRFFAASLGDQVRLMESVLGEEIHRVAGRNAFYNQIVFSDDGSKLLIANGEHRTYRNISGSFMTLFDLHGQQGEVLFGGDRIMDIAAVSISADNRRIASLDQRGIIALWDATTGDEISNWSHVNSPSDLHNIIGEKDMGRNARFVWTNPLIWGLSSVAISPDGKRILSGGADRCMRLWTIDGRKIAEYPHDTHVVKVAFCPDGRRALSGGWDGSVCLWELP